MTKQCPNKNCAAPFNFKRDGTFRRKDDSKFIQRFRCKTCGKKFSSATFSETYCQKKRRINFTLLKFLSSTMSIRRAALVVGVNPKTVARKLRYLGKRCERLNRTNLERYQNQIHNIQIDDLITKEKTKLKPLSVTIAVDEKTRRILATEVSRIPSFGHLAKISLKKYGKRKDEHFDGLTRVFKKIAPIVSDEVVVKSDELTRYSGFISSFLPGAKHLTFKSERGCVAGQGELKKVKFDPLFTINHTCALLRGSINRLIRKTWCTTQDPNRLKEHLEIFVYYYNEFILS